MKKMTKKAEKVAQVAANKYAAYEKKVRALAGWVRLTDDVIRAAYKADMTAEGCAVVYACQTAVGAAIWPLKLAAVESAAKNARDVIDRMIVTLKNADWNLDTVAPYPSRTEPEFMQRAKSDARNRYNMLFNTKSERYGNTPTIASRNEEYEQRYITRAEESAAYQYNLFVLKLVNKIGPGAVSATLEGNHVWHYSILSVTMKATVTRVDRWKTQQIENRSKLGLWFPQWPSRLMKGWN